MSASPNSISRERGSGLIVVIMIVAFMLAVGMLLLTVTGVSPRASDSLRLQGMAFDAAEAGFDSSWAVINEAFISHAWESFAGQYRTTFDGAEGFDDPNSPVYFRKLTDAQIVADIEADPTGALFVSQVVTSDPRCAFTVFLVPDEAPNTIPVDDRDCLMVCIGRGPRNTYKRLEIVLEVGS